jgi:hypothetical protein
MKRLFSAKERGETWRKLWVWLAEAEKELGIDISDEAIAQMKEHIEMTDNDFVVAAAEEVSLSESNPFLFWTDLEFERHALLQCMPYSSSIYVMYSYSSLIQQY